MSKNNASYEAVEKVKDNAISITNVNDFVKKIIDIDYARTCEFIIKISKIYSEEMDKETEDISVSLKDINIFQKYKYSIMPIYSDIIKNAGKPNMELIKETISALANQVINDMENDISNEIKNIDNVSVYSVYLRKIERIEKMKSNLSPILDFVMDIVQGKMIQSMMKPISDSLINAYKMNDPFKFISIEEYYGVNEESIRKLIKVLKVIAE